MPERNPFEETMMAERAGMNVPQRTVRPTMRDVAGPGNEGLGLTVDLPYGRAPTPIQSGGRRGEFSPPLYSGRNPFIQPIQTGGRQGEFSTYDQPWDPDSRGEGIFGGRNPRSFAANDTLGALLGENNIWEAQEGVGEYAGGPGMQNVRVEGNLWKQAHANVAKQFGVSAGEVSGKASQGAIQREFKRLKEIFYSKKYGTGIMKGIGKGSPLGMMMELMPLDPALESIGEVLDPEAPGWV